MIAKGYNIEGLSHQDRVLNEYTNEYGFNLNHKQTTDIFKLNTKPKYSGFTKKSGKR